MGAVTSIIGTAIGAIGGIAKGISGSKQRKKYQRMIENYERQDLDNMAQMIQINRTATDQQREDVNQQQANMVDALSRGGSRNLIGGLGRVGQAGVQANRMALQDLNQQEQRRQYAIASDNQRIRQMQEQREMQDLAGMGAMYNAGNQTMWSGFGDIAQAGMYAMRMADFGQPQAQVPGGDPTATATATADPTAGYSAHTAYSPSGAMQDMGQASGFVTRQPSQMMGGQFINPMFGNPFMNAGYGANQLNNYYNPPFGAFGQ